MPEQYATVILLCEDRQQQTFVYRYLRHKGVNPRRIRTLTSPAGSGSGEHYVRQEYPKQVAAIRAKSYLRVGLVAVLDADTHDVSTRHRQLDESLTQAKQEARGSNEAIALVVPRRNIETWIHFLRGTPVNEVDRYAKLTEPGACEDAVREFATRCPGSIRPGPLPSLSVGCHELTRFLEFVKK
jgi:hypothetical protein